MGLMEEDENSMDNWYPKIVDLDINTPKTVRIDAEMFPDNSDDIIGYSKEEAEKAIEQLGGCPVFIRTDKASAKHKMKQISKVESKDEVHKKIHDLARDNRDKGFFGVHFNSIYFREWLNISHGFRAFHGDVKVGYEIRAFVRDGEIECKHFYWVKDAIERPNKEKWETLWEFGKAYTMNRWDEAKEQVEKVAEVFDGWWSVDLALTEEGEWYVIDLARGKDSFHPPSCEYAPEEMKERYGDE